VPGYTFVCVLSFLAIDGGYMEMSVHSHGGSSADGGYMKMSALSQFGSSSDGGYLEMNGPVGRLPSAALYSRPRLDPVRCYMEPDEGLGRGGYSARGFPLRANSIGSKPQVQEYLGMSSKGEELLSKG